MKSSKRSRDEKKRCFYCDATVERGAYQMDHFPVPRRHGGIETVVACTTCHSSKDRVRLDDWSLEWVSELAMSFGSMPRVARIFLAKAMAMMSDASAWKCQTSEIVNLKKQLADAGTELDRAKAKLRACGVATSILVDSVVDEDGGINAEM